MMNFRSDEIEKMVAEIGDEKFRIESAPFPFNLLWFRVDGHSNGRINLKIVEGPAVKL